MNLDKETHSTRIAYFDHLRIMCTLAVIMIHVSGQNISAVDIFSYPWKVFTFFNSSASWAIPVFVMLSGALFLDPDRPFDPQKLYRKTLPRIVTAFLFWSAIYAVECYLKYGNVKHALLLFLEGRYHMWYLFLIFGLYLAVPLLRKITESKRATEYFLLTAFSFVILIPDLITLFELLELPYTKSFLILCRQHLETLSFSFPVIYTFYYVLGVYLTKYDFHPRWVKCSFLAGAFGYASEIAFVFQRSYITGESSIIYPFRLNALAVSIGLFFFAKYVIGKRKPGSRASQILQKLSGYTFGVYLVHVLVLDQLRLTFSLTTLSFDPLVSVFLIEICTAAISLGITSLLHRIPILNKYIV